jgi:uracil-DNA glycosylase family 4
MLNFCPPSGFKNSKIAAIGEAPGKQELLADHPMPFIGPSGRLLWTLAQRQNIYRNDCYCTNVIKVSAPQNPMRSMPIGDLMLWRDSLRRELASCSPNLYIALGNTALWALCDVTGITNWRGSILSAFDGKKCIPMLHPANILHAPENCYLLERDLELAGIEYLSPEKHLPEITYITKPTLTQALSYLAECKRSREFAFDIETAGKSGIATCISFAYRDDEAISIPMQGVKYWKPDEYFTIFKALSALLGAEDCLKIGQNISYDIIGLYACGIEVKPPIYDTMHMHHAIDPLSSHSLAFQSSYFTRYPFWKEWDTAPDNSDVDDLYSYNCKDSVVTRHLKVSSYTRMRPDTHKLYEQHYQSVQPTLIQMYIDGLCVDKPLQTALAQQYYSEASELEERICKGFGVSTFNLNSAPQLCHLLYDVLKFPVQYNRKGHQRIRTADDDALIQVYLDTQNDLVLKIRDVKEKRKLASFMLPKSREAQKKRQTWDGRWRCEYKMTTGTGRLSSAASLASRIGINMQNIPMDVRRTIVPAPGCIFLEPDYMQAEARVIAYDALDYKYMDLFSKPDEFDMHWYNAELIMQRPRSELTSLERNTCKHVVFGSFYDMKERKLQETVLKYTDPPVFIPIDECRKRQQAFKDAVPTFLERQERIKHEVLTTGRQVSPTGQIVIYHEIVTDSDLKFCFGRRDYSETLRSAYSMIPQNVVCRLVNRGMVLANAELRKRNLGRVAAQVHDSVLTEVLDNETSIVSAFHITREALELPIEIRGHRLSLPTDYKLGYHWGCVDKQCTQHISGIRTEEQLVAAYRSLKR